MYICLIYILVLIIIIIKLMFIMNSHLSVFVNYLIYIVIQINNLIIEYFKNKILMLMF